MLNILQVSSSLGWGGREMYVSTLSKELIKRGHNVKILCNAKGNLYKEVKNCGLNVEKINFTNKLGSYFSISTIFQIANIINKNNINIVHCHFSRDLWLLVLGLKLSRKRIPIVLTKHIGSYIKKKDLFHKFIYKNVSCVIVISNVIRKNVIETCPIDEKKVLTLYYGVDLKKYSIDSSDSDKIRKEFNIKPDDFVIGLVGRISPGKGHKEFLMACNKLKDYPNLRFIVVGGSSKEQKDYEVEIRNLTKELNLSDRVIFTGFRNDVPSLMSIMDIVAMPSYAEAFGLVAIEAMALGKSVVATNTDGVLDIITDGEDGILIPPKDSESLANAFEKLINNKDLRIKIGESAYKKVREKFNLEEQVIKTEKLYNDLLLGRS